jgi:4-hydroxybenzoate polyprenyltransferase
MNTTSSTGVTDMTPSTARPPLVVDLDGTLVLTDTLVESIIELIKRSPFNIFMLAFWLISGRGLLKAKIAEAICPNVRLFPYRQGLLDFIQAEKNLGRRIILATATHESVAADVAQHLGLFDCVIGSNAQRNLKGKAKLRAIHEEVGTDFVYAGDSYADLPIWQASASAVLVGVPARLRQRVCKLVPVECEFSPAPLGISTVARCLRVHQWLKNLLLFVPFFTAFSLFDASRFMVLIAAFCTFSLAASATYIVNDLWDLSSDRLHPRKRLRPLASGRMPITTGIGIACAALLAALVGAALISVPFLLMLLTYIVVTSSYSWALKKYVVLDVIVLASLYTLRIFAGGVAIGVAISSWLLAFSMFVFLSLALVKRCSELISLDPSGPRTIRGRDYRGVDLAVLWPLGLGSALCSVVVFGLFITSAETQGRYGTPGLLWAVAVGLVYWLARLWITTARGEMHDDPVVYAVKDRGSLTTVLLMVITVLVSHYLVLPYS